MAATEPKPAQTNCLAIQTGLFDIDGQQLHVGIRDGSSDRPPLLMFNGIGANLELAFPFIEALDDTTAVIFDVPGVGGSPMPTVPYRPSTLARLARELLEHLGFDSCDVLGVSWGGRARTAIRPPQSGFLSEGDIGRDRVRGHDGTRQAQRSCQDGEPLPLHGSGLHALHRGGNLWRRVPHRSGADRASRRRDEGRFAHGVHASTASGEWLDQPALALVDSTADTDHFRHR